MVSQNSVVKPSFPGDLSFFMLFMDSNKSFPVISMSQKFICSVEKWYLKKDQ